MTGCGRFISLLLLLSIEPSLLALATTTGGTSSSSSSSSSDSANINYDKNDGGTATLHPPIYNNDSKNENNSNNRSDRDGNNNLQNFHVEKTLAPVLSLAKIGLTFQHQQQQQRAHEPSTIVHYTCFGSLQSEADSSETESSSSTRHHQDQNQKNEDRHHNHNHHHHHHRVEAELNERMKLECCNQIAVAIENMCSSITRIRSGGDDMTRSRSRSRSRSTQQFEDGHAPVMICKGNNSDGYGHGHGYGGEFDRNQMEKKCRDIISHIPQIATSAQFGSVLPMFHMAIPLIIIGDGNRDKDGDGGTAINKYSNTDDDALLVQPKHVIPPSPPALQQYVYTKDNVGSKWSKSPDRLVYSPLSLTEPKNKIASTLDVSHEQSQQSIEQQTRHLRMAADGVVHHYPLDPTHLRHRFFQASLSSNLSVDGGMHRQLVHIISIPMLEIEASHNLIKGELYIMLPVSEGIFLDLDDPIQDNPICLLFRDANDGRAGSNNQDRTQCEVSVDVVTAEPDTVINIEQPSFVSPQHMVALHVHFKLEDPTVVESALNVKLQSQILTLEFISNLHLRYPMPILGTKLAKNDGLLDIYIPTPFLYDGKVESSTYCRHDETSACRNSQHYSLETTDGIHKHHSGSWGNFSAKVPAGLDNHHDFVMATTVIVSILGMWKILHDMSRISQWK